MGVLFPNHVHATIADRAACRALIRTGSRSFFAASLILPRAMRDPSYALYAFCRIADDAVDLSSDQDTAITELKDRLDRIYRGEPDDDPVDRAFADVVMYYQLPRELLDALIEGFEWDAAGKRYETIEDICAYGARVAGSVGAMMTVLMETRDADTLARACDLGVAMQLTNIARDVGEDAAAGRIYLPLAWMREEGIDPDAWLANPSHDAALGRVVARLLEEADRLYERSGSGIRDLPLSCRPAINAARRIYSEIGREVERQDCDSVAARAFVGTSRKLALVGQAIWEVPLLAAKPIQPPLEETEFLVRAAAQYDAEPRRSVFDLPGRWVGVIEMFERMAEREAVSKVAPGE